MVISIQRLPWAGDPAVLTHGNADMSQLGEKTAPFPSSLRSIPSSLDLSLLSSLLHSLPTARASTGMEWDCLFPGETGIPCKWEHLFSLGLYQHQHPHHCSCFFPTHLSDFCMGISAHLGLSQPPAAALPFPQVRRDAKPHFLLLLHISSPNPGLSLAGTAGTACSQLQLPAGG